MPTVELTTGLPGSGKSTYACLVVHGSGGRTRRVCMDSIREMMDNGHFSPEHERTALKVQASIIVTAVRAGFNVVVDNTHLTKRMPESIRTALAPYDVTWKVADFRGVPVDECIRRDLQRAANGERNVGRAVIERMARRTSHWELTTDWLSAYPRPQRYQSNPLLPAAVICDLDGNLALHQGRDPYDTARCGQDMVNSDVAITLDYFRQSGRAIILVTGRQEEYRPQTIAWLEKWNLPYDKLLMRPSGDLRRDDIVKAEIFDQYIRDYYDTRLVLDDRNRVVNMWRHNLGLPTWQTAEGDF